MTQYILLFTTSIFKYAINLHHSMRMVSIISTTSHHSHTTCPTGPWHDLIICKPLLDRYQGPWHGLISCKPSSWHGIISCKPSCLWMHQLWQVLHIRVKWRTKGAVHGSFQNIAISFLVWKSAGRHIYSHNFWHTFGRLEILIIRKWLWWNFKQKWDFKIVILGPKGKS